MNWLINLYEQVSCIIFRYEEGVCFREFLYRVFSKRNLGCKVLHLHLHKHRVFSIRHLWPLCARKHLLSGGNHEWRFDRTLSEVFLHYTVIHYTSQDDKFCCCVSVLQGINGILADEMGLGKTVQSIAFLSYLAEVSVFVIIVVLGS